MPNGYLPDETNLTHKREIDNISVIKEEGRIYLYITYERIQTDTEGYLKFRLPDDDYTRSLVGQLRRCVREGEEL